MGKPNGLARGYTSSGMSLVSSEQTLVLHFTIVIVSQINLMQSSIDDCNQYKICLF